MRTLTALRSPHSPEGRRSEAGYNMVVLIVAITVLNVLVAAMLPLWSTQIRREKEEELIFRGFQYAEALRVFHNQFGRYPNRLEELLKVRPRKIRQLRKDPMTEDGKWRLIFKDQPQELPTRDPRRNGPRGNPPPQENGDPNGRPQLGPAAGDTVEVGGEIIGVRSKSHEKSMIVLFGRERYDEWKFTVDLLTGGGGGRFQADAGGTITGIAPAGGSLTFSTRWIGRPSRFENQTPVPQDGTMPDGTRRDGGGTRNRRPPPTKP